MRFVNDYGPSAPPADEYGRRELLSSFARVVQSLTFHRVDWYGGNDSGVILWDHPSRRSDRRGSLLSFQTLTRNPGRVARQP